MADLAVQKPVKLSVSLIYKNPDALKAAEDKLIERYGPIESLEKYAAFDLTDYYQNEFGSNLKRKFICFKKLLDKDEMPGVKLTTNMIEDTAKEGENRRVNIDPGYVTEAKLILLTTKDYTHRVFIGNRIFAESTLYFQDGTFNPWPWTYPDYASDDLIAFFNQIRALYMDDIDGEKR